MSKAWPLLLVVGAAALGVLLSINIPAAVVAAAGMLLGGLVWRLRKSRKDESRPPVTDVNGGPTDAVLAEPAMSRSEEREVDHVLAEIRQYLDAARELETSYPGRSKRRPPDDGPTGSMSASIPEEAPSRRPRAGQAMSKSDLAKAYQRLGLRYRDERQRYLQAFNRLAGAREGLPTTQRRLDEAKRKAQMVQMRLKRPPKRESEALRMSSDARRAAKEVAEYERELQRPARANCGKDGCKAHPPPSAVSTTS